MRRAAPYVLVVDDAEDNRELYASYFFHSGFRVDVAVNGEEALAKIERQTPDVVIMDLSMPKVDGWEATRRIKGNPRWCQAVVIVVTGVAVPEELARATAAGADRVLTKPCTGGELHALVLELLSTGRC